MDHDCVEVYQDQIRSPNAGETFFSSNQPAARGRRQRLRAIMSAVLKLDRKPLLFAIARARKLVAALTAVRSFDDAMSAKERMHVNALSTEAFARARQLEAQLGDVRMSDLTCDELAALNGYVLREPHELRVFERYADAETFKTKYLSAYPVAGYGTSVNIHPLGKRFEVRVWRTGSCE